MRIILSGLLVLGVWGCTKVDEPVAEKSDNPPPPPSNNQTIPNKVPDIVEWPKYGQEHPDVVVVDGKVEGFDPYSAAASAYVNLPARIEGLAAGYDAKLQSQINAVEGGGDPQPLSYKAFIEDWNKSGRKMKATRPYRLFGYNPKTGKVVLLEDKALKAQIYKDQGIKE